MNAVVKKTAPTLEQARAVLAQHERDLIAMQRANSAARSAIVAHLAQGNEQAAEQCRAEIAASAKRIASLTDAVDQAKEVVAAVIDRERTDLSKEVYAKIRAESSAFKTALESFDDSIVSFCANLLEVRRQQDVLEGAQRSAGVPVDIDSVRTKFMGLLEQRLFVETGGVIGKPPYRSIDDTIKYQLASFRRIAKSHNELVLRSARNTLGVRESN